MTRTSDPAATLIRYRKRIRLLAATLALTVCFFSVALIRVYADDRSQDAASGMTGPGETAASVQKQPKVIDVARGDTLWSIAGRHAPEGKSVRAYIAEIKKLNGLSGSGLREGQLLYLP